MISIQNNAGDGYITPLSLSDFKLKVTVDKGGGAGVLKWEDLVSYFFIQHSTFTIPPSTTSRPKPSKRALFKYEKNYLYAGDAKFPDGWPKTEVFNAVRIGNKTFLAPTEGINNQDASTLDRKGDALVSEGLSQQFLNDSVIQYSTLKKDLYVTYYDGDGRLVASYGSDTHLSKKYDLGNEFVQLPDLIDPNGDSVDYSAEDVLSHMRLQNRFVGGNNVPINSYVNYTLSNNHKKATGEYLKLEPRLVNSNPTIWREQYTKTVSVVQINKPFKIDDASGILEDGFAGDFIGVDQFGFYFRIPQEKLSTDYSRKLDVRVEKIINNKVYYLKLPIRKIPIVTLSGSNKIVLV